MERYRVFKLSAGGYLRSISGVASGDITVSFTDRLEDAHHFPADADVEQYGLDFMAGGLVQVEIKEVQ